MAEETHPLNPCGDWDCRRPHTIMTSDGTLNGKPMQYHSSVPALWRAGDPPVTLHYGPNGFSKTPLGMPDSVQRHIRGFAKYVREGEVTLNAASKLLAMMDTHGYTITALREKIEEAVAEMDREHAKARHPSAGPQPTLTDRGNARYSAAAVFAGKRTTEEATELMMLACPELTPAVVHNLLAEALNDLAEKAGSPHRWPMHDHGA